MDNYQNPKPGKTYISPRLDSFGMDDRKVRIASKVIETDQSYAFGQIKDELVLRTAPKGQTHIKATFFEDPRAVRVLNLQGWTVATEKPHNASFSFGGKELRDLYDFVNNILSIDFESGAPINISDDALQERALSDQRARQLFKKNQELFSELARSEITKEDVVALGYRKKQLNNFEKLLNDADFFDRVCENNKLSHEALWQKFFEKNTWIFGYGLNFIQLSALDNKKLEQVVSGYSLTGPGKRVDALMKSKGLISSLCFVEIKTHRTALLASKAYRSGCWPVSTELAGAVSQVHGTAWAAAENIRSKLVPADNGGELTGEEIYNFQPKSFLVVGSLQEFFGENGINEQKYRSFELFRRNALSPEVITFDELYERAKFIVRESES